MSTLLSQPPVLFRPPPMPPTPKAKWLVIITQVTKWYMNVPSRPCYNTFISSFVNTANRAWVKAIKPGKVVDLTAPLSTVLNDPIPTDDADCNLVGTTTRCYIVVSRET